MTDRQAKVTVLGRLSSGLYCQGSVDGSCVYYIDDLHEPNVCRSHYDVKLARLRINNSV